MTMVKRASLTVVDAPCRRGGAVPGITARPGEVWPATRDSAARTLSAPSARLRSRPDGNSAPFRDIWTHQALADALEAKTGIRLSVSEVGRILRSANLRAHRVKQWLESTDPDFKVKADRVCNLHLDPLKDVIISPWTKSRCKPWSESTRLIWTRSTPRFARPPRPTRPTAAQTPAARRAGAGPTNLRSRSGPDEPPRLRSRPRSQRHR
jgi:hypothetical protein